MVTISDWLTSLDFYSFILSLQQGGWFDFVFPFMLVYAIVYTILRNVDLFKDRKSIKVIIALVFALFAIAFPITDETNCGVGYYGQGVVSGCTVGTLMMSLFPGVTAFSMGILALYIVIAMLGIDLTRFFGLNDERNNYIKWILGAIGLIVVVYYYAIGFGWQGFGEGTSFYDFFTDPGLYILVLFGIFFFWIGSDDLSEEERIKELEKKLKEKKGED